MLTKLRNAWARTGVLARAIVAKRVTIVAGAAAIIGALVTYGVIPVELGQRATGWVVGGLGIIGAVVGAFWAQRGTTPADPLLGPISSNGVPLIEAVTPDSVAARLLARDLDDMTPAKHDARE